MKLQPDRDTTFFVLVGVDKGIRYFIFGPNEMTQELEAARKTHSPTDHTDGFGIERAKPYENKWDTLPLP